MSVIDLPDLVVASGGDFSSAIGRKWLEYIIELVIHAPESLAGTVTVEVTDEDPDEVDSPTWRDLVVDGSVVTVAAGEATVIDDTGFAGLRLAEGTQPASEERFPVTADDEGP